MALQTPRGVQAIGALVCSAGKVGQRVNRGGELPGMGDATHGRPVERKAVLRHASQIAAGQGGRPRGQEEMNWHGAYRRSTGEHGQPMTEKGCISCLARRYAS